MGDLHLSIDEAIKKLEGLEGFNLKPDQRRALEELHMGSDLCLIALGRPLFSRATIHSSNLKQEF
jgi:hypothetical protein